jgi:hypothetical protein
MFIICAKGGKADTNSFLPQPWRIVSPALIFFLCMTILSIINLVIIQGGMKTFCDSMQKELPDISCDVAMNRYMDAAVDEIIVSPGTLYITLTIFNYVTFAFWLLSLLVLIARIIFVIDFQLVRVTIKTVEYQNPTSSFKVVEPEREGKKQTDVELATTNC